MQSITVGNLSPVIDTYWYLHFGVQMQSVTVGNLSPVTDTYWYLYFGVQMQNVSVGNLGPATGTYWYLYFGVQMQSVTAENVGPVTDTYWYLNFGFQMTATIQNYAKGLSLKTKELRREKKRSDTLLYQMLPKPVALQLKVKNSDWIWFQHILFPNTLQIDF